MIRNTPVVNSKYLKHWQNAKFKLKMQKMLGGLNEELKIHGTTTLAGIEGMMDENTDLAELIAKKSAAYVIDKHVEVTPFLVIRPHGWFKAIWNWILIALLIYTATLMPLRLAFYSTPNFSTWFYVTLVIDCLFFIDVVINCLSAYYD